MLVGGNDLPQRGGTELHAGVFLYHLGDHGLEGADLALQVFSSCFRPGEAQTKLEILLIANENICLRSKLPESGAKLFLPPLPEGSPVVKVETHHRSVGFGSPDHLQAACCSLRAHGGNQAAQVQDSHALLPENALQIEVRRA